LPAFAEQWLCVTESMTGFTQQKNSPQWEASKFSDKPKYVISVSQENASSQYVVKELGKNTTMGSCQYYVNSNNEYFISCIDDYGNTFLFNKNGNRFQYSNVLGGYIYPWLKKRPPYVSIGLCSPF